MAEQSIPKRYPEEPNRTSSKRLYSKKEAVRRKWLKEYGRIDEDGNYQRNKACLNELFNLLDFVSDNALCSYIDKATFLGLQNDGQEQWSFQDSSGKTRVVRFRPPTVYSRRIYALNQFLEHALPKGVNGDTRDLRNDVTHINATVMTSQLQLDMDELWQPLYDIGTALCQLGMLDRRDIFPSFDSLRVREGGSLLDGKYRVLELLGEGGMSRVYRGRQDDNFFRRDVAIKELKPDSYLKENIRNECAVMMRLKHPHIPAVYDAFSQNGTYYIVMELIDGERLSSYLQTHRLSAAQQDRIANDLIAILSYLHADGRALIYGDLKPDNILIDRNGDPNLIDFGITRLRDGNKLQRYLSPKWSAPELLEGKSADQRSDVYALGKVLQLLYSQEQDDPLQRVFAMCTAADPNARFSDVHAVSRALDAVRSSRERLVPPQQAAQDAQKMSKTPQRQEPLPPKRDAKTVSERRRKAEYVVLALLILVVLLAAVFLIVLLKKPAQSYAPVARNGAVQQEQLVNIQTLQPHWDGHGRPHAL